MCACVVVATAALSTGCAPSIYASRDVDGHEEQTAAIYRYSIYERGVTFYLLQLFILYPAITNHVTVVAMIDDEAFPWVDSRSAMQISSDLLGRAKRADLFGTTRDNEPGKILIPVGRHQLKVDYTWEGNAMLCFSGYYGLGGGCIRDDQPVSSFSIEFDAQPGHEYRVFAYAPNPEEHKGWVWIEDLTTEKIVSGKKPPALSYTEIPGIESPTEEPAISLPPEGKRANQEATTLQWSAGKVKAPAERPAEQGSDLTKQESPADSPFPTPSGKDDLHK